MRTTGHTTNKISKKLWRGQRSKSQSRGQPQISSPWSPPPVSLDNKVSESLRSQGTVQPRTEDTGCTTTLLSTVTKYFLILEIF